MRKQIYMYENKINKITRKVNKVGLDNYLLIYRTVTENKSKLSSIF